MFTGTIASNIAYGRPDATREQIERAARDANCEFVWGMPHGFDTEGMIPSLSPSPFSYLPTFFLICSWPHVSVRRAAPATGNCTSAAWRTRHPCTGRGDELFRCCQ